MCLSVVDVGGVGAAIAQAAQRVEQAVDVVGRAAEPEARAHGTVGMAVVWAWLERPWVLAAAAALALSLVLLVRLRSRRLRG